MSGRTIIAVLHDPRHAELASAVEAACISLDRVPLGDYAQLEVAFNELCSATKALTDAERVLMESEEGMRAAIVGEPT